MFQLLSLFLGVLELNIRYISICLHFTKSIFIRICFILTLQVIGKMESEDMKKLLPTLRKKARQEYLGKRRDDKVLDLEQEIEEEAYYFGDQK